MFIHLGAVRNCMSKMYEQRQPRDWENSSHERPAIGPRKGNAIIVNLHAAWCLSRGADARLAQFDRTHRVSSGMLNVDFVCAGSDSAFKMNLITGMGWKLQTGVLPPNSAIGRRVPPVSPCPPEPHYSCQLPGMDGGRPALETRSQKAKQQRCPTLLRDWTLWDRDWIASVMLGRLCTLRALRGMPVEIASCSWVDTSCCRAMFAETIRDLSSEGSLALGSSRLLQYHDRVAWRQRELAVSQRELAVASMANVFLSCGHFGSTNLFFRAQHKCRQGPA